MVFLLLVAQEHILLIHLVDVELGNDSATEVCIAIRGTYSHFLHVLLVTVKLHCDGVAFLFLLFLFLRHYEELDSESQWIWLISHLFNVLQCLLKAILVAKGEHLLANVDREFKWVGDLEVLVRRHVQFIVVLGYRDAIFPVQ